MIDPIKLKKDELHKKIDDTFSNIIKNVDNIFDKIKFNETQLIEETSNLEILTSTESFASKLNDLVKVVYEMKVEYLKKSEYDYPSRKNNSYDLNKNVAEFIKKMIQLQEMYNFINSILKENKQNKYYKYSLNYDLD